MSVLPNAVTTYLARSRRATKIAKWVAVGLLIGALLANGWFIWQFSQASADDGASKARIAAAQGRTVLADEEVVATKLRSDNALHELNSNLRFMANSATIQGLSVANTTALAGWEKAKLSAIAAATGVITARVMAVDASNTAADNAQHALVAGAISIVIVLMGGGIAFALSMSEIRAAAMISIASNGFPS